MLDVIKTALMVAAAILIVLVMSINDFGFELASTLMR